MGETRKDLKYGGAGIAERGVVTLWDLLTLVCCTMPISGATASAKIAKAGFGGYTLSIITGIFVGVACAWAMRAVANNMVARTKQHPESLKEWHFRALYFGAMLWIVLALFLGAFVSSALLRLVS